MQLTLYDIFKKIIVTCMAMATSMVGLRPNLYKLSFLLSSLPNRQGIRRYNFFVTSYKYRSFRKKVTSYSYSYFQQKSN